MVYDPVQYYNVGLAIVVSCAAAALAFRLIPPLSAKQSAHRLVLLTLRDLRRLASGSPISNWDDRLYGRLAAMPQHGRNQDHTLLIAMLSTGSAIVRLRAADLGCLRNDLTEALLALAHGHVASARSQFALLDSALEDAERDDPTLLNARADLLAITRAIGRYPALFRIGASQ